MAASNALKRNYFRAFSAASKRWMQFWHAGDLVEASHYAREKLGEPLGALLLIEQAGTNAKRFHPASDEHFDKPITHLR